MCTAQGCKATFATCGSREKQLRTHTGEKPYVCTIEGCQAAFAQTSSISVHTKTIHTERGRQRQKKREEQVARFLTAAGIPFERETSVSFCGEVEKKRASVDFVLYFDDRVVCLEVDEGQHNHYDVSCDAGRMLNIAAEHVKRSPLPLHFVRFNPESYKVNGEALPKRTLQNKHFAMLRATNAPVQSFAVMYLFCGSQDGLPCIAHDPGLPADLREVCRLEAP